MVLSIKENGKEAFSMVKEKWSLQMELSKKDTLRIMCSKEKGLLLMK